MAIPNKLYLIVKNIDQTKM